MKDNLRTDFQPVRDRTAAGTRWGQSGIKLLMGRVLKVTRPVGCRWMLNGHWAVLTRVDRVCSWTAFCFWSDPRTFVSLKLWTKKVISDYHFVVIIWRLSETLCFTFSMTFAKVRVCFELLHYFLCYRDFLFTIYFITKCCSGYNVVEHISLSLFQPSYLSNVCWTENW